MDRNKAILIALVVVATILWMVGLVTGKFWISFLGLFMCMVLILYSIT